MARRVAAPSGEVVASPDMVNQTYTMRRDVDVAGVIPRLVAEAPGVNNKSAAVRWALDLAAVCLDHGVAGAVDLDRILAKRGGER